MNCNTTHYRANSSSVPGDPTSYFTEPPRVEQLTGLTYATITPEARAESRASWGRREVIGSGIVLLLILACYLYFRG